VGSISITRSNLSHQRPAPAKAILIGEERSSSPALACIAQFSHARRSMTGVDPQRSEAAPKSGHCGEEKRTVQRLNCLPGLPQGILRWPPENQERVDGGGVAK